MKIEDPLEGDTVVVEGPTVCRFPIISGSVLLLLHLTIDANSQITKLLRLQQSGCTHEITVQQNAEVADCVLEVAVGKFRNVGERYPRLCTICVEAVLEEEYLLSVS
jgi:hypothetical protein